MFIHCAQWWIYKSQHIYPDHCITARKYFSSISKRRLYNKQASKFDWLAMDAKLMLFVISAVIAVATSYPFNENFGFMQQAQCNGNSFDTITRGPNTFTVEKCLRSMFVFSRAVFWYYIIVFVCCEHATHTKCFTRLIFTLLCVLSF